MVKKTLIIASSVIATAIVVDEVVSKITKRKPLRKKIMDKGNEIVNNVYDKIEHNYNDNPDKVENTMMAFGAGALVIGGLLKLFRHIFK